MWWCTAFFLVVNIMSLGRCTWASWLSLRMCYCTNSWKSVSWFSRYRKCNWRSTWYYYQIHRFLSTWHIQVDYQWLSWLDFRSSTESGYQVHLDTQLRNSELSLVKLDSWHPQWPSGPRSLEFGLCSAWRRFSWVWRSIQKIPCKVLVGNRFIDSQVCFSYWWFWVLPHTSTHFRSCLSAGRNHTPGLVQWCSGSSWGTECPYIPQCQQNWSVEVF